MAKKKLEETETIDVKKIEKDLNKFLETKKDEITKDIISKIDDQVEFKVSKRLKEEEKKFIRGKNSKIIRRDIAIILLIALLGYFGYCLYKVDYFGIKTKVVEVPKKDTPGDNKSDETNPTIDDKPNASYYIKEFGYLIDTININDEEVYKFYKNKITKEELTTDQILKIAYHNLDKEEITLENNMITFKAESISKEIEKVLGDIPFTNQMFSYNNTKFMYYNETYLGLKEEDKELGLTYKVIDANEKDGKLEFEIIIGKVENNKLYNLNDKLVNDKYKDEDLTEYQDKLSKYKITFVFQNDKYTFASISN